MDIAGSVTTRFLTPWYSTTAIAPTNEVQWAVTRAGTMRRMFVNARLAGAPIGSNITYTLRVNGVNTLLAVTMAATATSASNLVNSVAVNPGDLVSVSVTKSAGLTTDPTDILATIEFGP